MKLMVIARKVVRFELGLWKSLYRWVFRRPRVGDAGAQAFSYAGVVTPVLIGITVVSMIEIPVMHLLLPWQGVRVVLFLLGVQTLFWMIGLLASMIVHPHAVGERGLRIRYGAGLDFTIDWADIETLRTRMRSVPNSRTIQYEQSAMSVAVGSQTNIDVVLRRPITLPLFSGAASEPVTEVRIYADSAAGLVAAARDRMAQPLPAGPLA